MAGERSFTQPSYSFDDPSHTPDTPFYFIDPSSSIAVNAPTHGFDATSIPFTGPSNSGDLETLKPYATSTTIDRENITTHPSHSENQDPGNATNVPHSNYTKNEDQQQSFSHHRHRLRPPLLHHDRAQRQQHHVPLPSVTVTETNYGDFNELFARLDGPGPSRLLLERSSYNKLYFTDTSPSLVFVGNLPSNLQGINLKNRLEQEIGTVRYVKIMRDKTRVSLGFAMVKFEMDHDGQRALNMLNDTLFYGRRLRVYKHRKPALIYEDDPSQFCHLLVANLPNDASFPEMKTLFMKAGRVMAITVASDVEFGLSQNTGLVTFSDQKEANEAITMFRGYEWNDCKLSMKKCELPPPLPASAMLRHTTSRSQRRRERAAMKMANKEENVATKPLDAAHPPHPSNTPIDSQPIPPDIPDTDSKEVDHGRTVDDLLANLNDRQTRSWMQVLPPETAANVIAALGTTAAYVLQNVSPAQAITTLAAIAMSNLPVSPGTVSGPDQVLPSHGPNQILVSNLPLDTTSQDLVDLFVHVGPVVRTEILWLEGRPRGEGLVRFQDQATCERAIERFNGYIYGEQELKISLDNAAR